MAGKIGVFIVKFVLLAKENSLTCTNLKGLALSTNPLRDLVRLDSDWFFAFVLMPAGSDISRNHSRGMDWKVQMDCIRVNLLKTSPQPSRPSAEYLQML